MSPSIIPDPDDTTVLHVVSDLPHPLDQAAGVCPECGGAGEVRFNLSSGREPWHDNSAECARCAGEGILPDLDLQVRVSVVLDITVRADSASETEAREFLAGHVEALKRHVENRLRLAPEQLGFLPDGNREVLVLEDSVVERVEIFDVATARQDLAA
jgi:hypothetical protein